MSKNILMGVLAAILVVAVGTAAYNVMGADAAGNLPTSNGNSGQGGGQGNGYGSGQNGAANGSGVPQIQAQANLTSASSVHGTVSTYAYGTLTIQTDDGSVLGVQLGNQNYVASLGFAPQVGEGLTVYGFPGDQGLFAAISITMDNGQVYNFRESTGRPAWAGGNGRGNGNRNP